jgi:hypothetical protein
MVSSFCSGVFEGPYPDRHTIKQRAHPTILIPRQSAAAARLTAIPQLPDFPAASLKPICRDGVSSCNHPEVIILKELLILVLCVTGLVIAVSAISADNQPRSAAALRKLVESFPADQKLAAGLPWNDPERFNWHYIPRRRQGVEFKAMSPDSRQRLEELLQTELSPLGLETARRVMALDQILFEIEGRNPIRDPEAYNLVFFGDLGSTSGWSWRFEGHHLSMNFTYEGAKRVSATPMFYGANPATVQHGPEKGTRTLAEEEDQGRRLLSALSQAGRTAAVISATAPSDILTGASRTVRIGEPQGLSYGAMNGRQREMLLELIGVYLGRLANDAASEKREELSREGLENLHFAWAGGDQPGTPHYYRIHGPTLLIEYDNTQNRANHIHTVIRDPRNDFGEDPLAAHYGHAH